MDGSVKSECNVTVGVKALRSILKDNENAKPTLMGKSVSAKSITLTVKNGNQDIKEGCVAIYTEDGYKKLDLSKYNMYFNKKKKKKNKFNMKKNKTYSITISKIKKNKLLFFKVGMKGYWSNSVGIAAGVPKLTAERKGNTIVLKWSKIKNAKGYVIYRDTDLYKASSKKKPYKTIKSGKTLTFVDKNVKPGTVYYYSIKTRKGKKRSKVKYETIVDVAKNIKYARSSSLFEKVVIDDSKNWNANEFSLPNGMYPSVKYRFTGTELEIHLYIDFVKYVKTGVKVRGIADLIVDLVALTNDPDDKINGELYTTRFIRGVKRAYDKRIIASSKVNFGGKGKAFYTKLVIHRARKEEYDPRQRFIQVRIGGEAPTTLYGGDTAYHFAYEEPKQWFHAAWCSTDENLYEINGFPYIHIPTVEQLSDEHKGTFEEPSKYGAAAAHEMGHILGLDDAYSKEYYTYEDGKKYRITYDRLAQNDETCIRDSNDPEPEYYNMMEDDSLYSKIRANDVEMMLKAYADSEYGIPITTLQSYNVYHDENTGYDFSQVIMDREDRVVENLKEEVE